MDWLDDGRSVGGGRICVQWHVSDILSSSTLLCGYTPQPFTISASYVTQSM